MSSVTNGTRTMAIGLVAVIAGIGTVAALIGVGVITRPEPPLTVPAEVIVGEDENPIPDIVPPTTLSVLMVPEVREGKSPRERCEDMGGTLTPEWLCYSVDY